MAIEVKKREGENISLLLYRFNKKVQHSGIVKEVKRRRFQDRSLNKRHRRNAALYRKEKQEELAHVRKYGHRLERQ
ncbi:30S ribosomal protein S21 [Candidatus Jorgensenbacteria bacterium]|nr:30S ribosomal protein S21 [Candidatus Jorgensenbacteria bacterium]